MAESEFDHKRNSQSSLSHSGDNSMLSNNISSNEIQRKVDDNSAKPSVAGVANDTDSENPKLVRQSGDRNLGVKNEDSRGQENIDTVNRIGDIQDQDEADEVLAAYRNFQEDVWAQLFGEDENTQDVNQPEPGPTPPEPKPAPKPGPGPLPPEPEIIPEEPFVDVALPKGTLPGIKIFNDWTYENWHTMAGTAQKSIRSLLQKLSSNPTFGSYVFDTGKPNKDAIHNCNSKPTVKAAKNMAEQMLVIANAWLAERGEDSTRNNRKQGFVRFSQSLQGFVALADIQMSKPELNQATDTSEELGEKDKELTADFEKTAQKSKVHYENRSATSVFQNLEKPIAALAPSADTSGEMEVGVKIPIPTVPGLYLGGSLGMEAENEGDKFTLGSESKLTVGIEGSIPHVVKGEIGFSLGGFIEASSSTLKDALRLMSYGFYRRVRESKIGKYADSLWGGSDTAEKFVERTEEDLLGEDSEAYVELGGAASIDAGVKAGDGGVVGLEAGAYAKTGKRYDKDTITDDSGNLQKGKSISEVGAAGSFSVSIADWEVGVSLDSKVRYVTDNNVSVVNAADKTQESSETNFEISAKTPAIPNDDKLKANLLALASALKEKAKQVFQSTNNPSASTNWVSANAALEQAFAVSSNEELTGENTEDTFGDLEEGKKSESKLGLSLSFGVEEEGGEETKKGSGNLSSINETEVAVSFMGAGVSVKASKSKNLLKISNSSTDGYKWKLG